MEKIKRAARLQVSKFSHLMNFKGNQFSFPVERLKFFTTIERYESFLDNVEGKFTDYCCEIHGWIPANPSKESVVEHLNEVYIDITCEDVDQNAYMHKEVVNCYSGPLTDKRKDGSLYNIFSYFVNKKAMLFVGNKGCGKTTFINYWLNNFTKSLEEMNIIWLRVDASKMYRTWGEKELRSYTLCDYHIAHTVYVVLSYSGLIDSLESNPVFTETINYITKSDDKIKKCLSRVLYIIKEVRARHKEAHDQPQKYIEITDSYIRCIFRNSIIFDACKKIYYEIVAYFSKKNLRQLIIIDGIDNITVQKEEFENYKALCQQTANLLTFMDIPIIGCPYSIAAVIRKETEVDIEYEIEQFLPEREKRHYAKGYILPPSIEKVLKKKAQVAASPKCNNIINSMKNLKDECPDMSEEEFIDKLNHLLKSYDTFSNDYLSLMLKEVIKRYKFVLKLGGSTNLKPSDFTDVESLLTICFNENLRECIDNFNQIYKIITLSKKNKIPHAAAASRLPEYLLLNGRTFLLSPKRKKREKGEAYYNIFYYPVGKTLQDGLSWYGLCSLRILQLLNKRKLPSNLVVSVITKLFKFKAEKVVAFQYKRLLNQGLVKHFISSHDQNDFDNRFMAQITDKGKFFLDFFFMYPDWAYFCALDTPLNDMVFDDTKQVRAHREFDLNFNENYFAAMIPTTTTFFRHIFTQHALDFEIGRETHKEYLDGSSGNTLPLFNDFNKFKEIFKIPGYVTGVFENYYFNAFKSLSKKNNKFLCDELLPNLLDIKYDDL